MEGSNKATYMYMQIKLIGSPLYGFVLQKQWAVVYNLLPVDISGQLSIMTTSKHFRTGN